MRGAAPSPARGGAPGAHLLRPRLCRGCVRGSLPRASPPRRAALRCAELLLCGAGSSLQRGRGAEVRCGSRCPVLLPLPCCRPGLGSPRPGAARALAPSEPTHGKLSPLATPRTDPRCAPRDAAPGGGAGPGPGLLRAASAPQRAGGGGLGMGGEGLRVCLFFFFTPFLHRILFIYLSVYLFIYPFIHLFIHLFIYLFIQLFTYSFIISPGGALTLGLSRP